MDERDVIRGAVKAVGLVKKGYQLKITVIVMAVFLAGLMLAGLLFPAGSARAADCQDTGPGTAGAAPDARGGSNDAGEGQDPRDGHAILAVRRDNALAIDKVAKDLKLPGRATLIALMTAMQESSLINIDHGDEDSVGLFQQRPSMDWGTKASIMKPEYAARSFFLGHGTNKGLTAVKNWEKIPLGKAAQAVQNSKYPDLYAGHESAMRQLAEDVGIDLERKGKATGNGKGGKPVTSANSECGVNQPGTPGSAGPGGSAGGKFSDGKQSWDLNNPRSVKDAIAWAKANAGSHSTKTWYRRCLAYTAIVYGWNVSGVTYAIDHYTVVPKSMRHDKDRHPPAGALMYWETGGRAGHIAVYLGDGKVASNDILRPGYIDIVDAELFETKWGATYVGWTPPVFPKAG